jgi:hypothetical protein
MRSEETVEGEAPSMREMQDGEDWGRGGWISLRWRAKEQFSLAEVGSSINLCKYSDVQARRRGGCAGTGVGLAAEGASTALIAPTG